ncbi:NAD dependent epimerase dehydratase family protein [Sporothrix brasiliensis 5110]|uniref:NAD dependent epimerase dehydratase family protein n=1 Tax=Sporothrix brasiliensis 5110 TaxID=1398154 RepID=A0A0C2F8W4_9PEZI|nr:NAD dependent epimerase dehydratase family protein [Sporothrix brasiliensis 5110]KIH87518.1 NAD dependent epimerase dehydratase family protein [Sporothrix brasiliensis 5110]
MSTPFVLITGTTGFIGAEVLHDALAKGYRVRVTVRKEEQVALTKARHADAGDRLEVLVVPDLSNKAALEKALSGGVDYIVHVASPLAQPGLDLHEGYINPAVNSTVALLEAATAAQTVKRVIITSSAVALLPLDWLSRPGYEAKEGVNRSLQVDLDAPIPDDGNAEFTKYQISKILAHRATLDYVDAAAKNGEKIPEIVTIHPFFVIGHDRSQLATDAPHGVNKLYLGSLQSPEPFVPSALVDVRDVSATHVAAITVPSERLEGKGRYTVTEVVDLGPRVTWEELAAYIKEKYPSFPLKLTGPGAFSNPATADTTRATRDFGVKFHDPLDTVGVLIEQNLA